MSFQIDRTSSHLLIIDIQEKLLPLTPNIDSIQHICIQLGRAANLLDVKSTLTEHYSKGLGHTPAKIRSLISEENIFEKVHFSCMGDQTIREHFEKLRSNNIKDIVICGLETHICVFQTATDLKEFGFNVYVVADATGARHSQSIQLAHERLKQNGIYIVNAEMVIYEWLKKAATPEFKTLRPILMDL